MKKKSEDTKLFVSTRLTAKLEGVTGITTSCRKCKFCRVQWKFLEEHPELAESHICSHCYAYRTAENGWSCWDNYDRNTVILAGNMHRSDLPNLTFNNAGSPFARFNTHGEIPNEKCLINFYKIARRNPNFRFALWTKRWGLLYNLAKRSGIRPPRNLTIVISSPLLGVDVSRKSLDMLESVGVHPDVVFTVHTKEDIEQNGVKINCGKRKCVECKKCYRHHSETIYVREELK